MQGDDDGPPQPGAFRHRMMGTYERRFLLNHEDLKMKFKKWMRKNLRKLSVVLAWNYLNERLLKKVDEATLDSHNIYLPISKRTAQNWMSKSKATRCGTQKTYYNDQHQKVDVLKHRDENPATLTKLQRRMRVWVILSKEEEDNNLNDRSKSPYPTSMPVSK